MTGHLWSILVLLAVVIVFQFLTAWVLDHAKPSPRPDWRRKC